jgi:hypothetical protein
MSEMSKKVYHVQTWIIHIPDKHHRDRNKCCNLPTRLTLNCCSVNETSIPVFLQCNSEREWDDVLPQIGTPNPDMHVSFPMYYYQGLHQ